MSANFSHQQTLSVTDTLSTTPSISLENFSLGRIIGRTYPSIVLTVYEAETPQGEYALCSDVDDDGIMDAINDNESVALPTVLAGSRHLKFVGDVDGDIVLILKSTGSV